MFPEDEADVRVAARARGRAHRHHATALGQRAQTVRERGLAHVVHHQVHPAFARVPIHLLPPFLLPIIVHHIRAQVARELYFLRPARGHVHERARHLRQLDGHAVHAAARAHHQHPLARAQAGAGEEHTPGSEVHQGRGRGLFQGEIIGHAHQVARGDRHVLRVHTRKVLAQDTVLDAQAVLSPLAPLAAVAPLTRVGDHPVAHLPARHLRPQGHDFTGHVRPQNVRHGQFQSLPPAAHPVVQPIQRRVVNLHHHLVRSRGRLGHIEHLQDIEAFTVFVEADGAHGMDLAIMSDA